MAITFKQARLQNGLTIVGEVDPDAASAAAGFFVKTGARDEAAPIMGVSHFLEHMMFKGTSNLTSHDLNRLFDEMGARNNAYTTAEMTCFHAHVLPERLDQATDLLGRMMRPALRQEDFDTEKGVILEEIAMYKDQPFWVLFEQCQERHFGVHPLGHRVLGTEQTIKDLARDQMREYFENRYSADNTVVSLAGRLDFERSVERIAGLCGGWQTTNVSRDNRRPEIPGGTVEIRDPKVSRGYLLMLAEGPAVADDRRYAAALLAQVLGASDNSRLHWSLIETGIAEEAQAGYEPSDGTGMYYIYASGDPEQLGEIRGVIEKQLADLVDSLTDDDLVRLRNKLATSVTLAGERPNDRMQRLGRLFTTLGRYRTLEEELGVIERISLDDLREVAKVFPITPRTVGTLMPEQA
ncbi:MAG: pitrilysin family protein [Planctomycetota bacterium]|nr:pitrilysin family protein [Planctomycetota bacterium]